MVHTILDCYTDEPSGLGVPPYLGTHTRYAFGVLDNPNYLTIDDLRNLNTTKKRLQKTNIYTKNKTRSQEQVKKILEKTKTLVIVGGVHTPGKYLGAVPGTLNEIIRLTKDLKCGKILFGPASVGSQLQGGKKTSNKYKEFLEKNFDYVIDSTDIKKLALIFGKKIKNNSYENIQKFIIKGCETVLQHPDFPRFLMAEIETGRGCSHGKCSFCTENLKHCLEFREQKDIISEMKVLRELGVKNFRFGKQSCFFSYKGGNLIEIEKLLKNAKNLKPSILHIDNVNPVMVNDARTKLVVKYCTAGNVCAFGAETFDKKVMKENNLNVQDPEQIIDAVKIVNKHGKSRGNNGMPKLLPGINILLGLIGESKKTLDLNYEYLKKILDNDLYLRRINIRQVAVFPGTMMEKVGLKYLKKNKKHYFRFRKKIREEIDYPMLKKVFPEGLILKDLRTEIHDGNTTFARQIGSYPIIVGIKERLELNKFVDVKIKKWMLRSVVGEVV